MSISACIGLTLQYIGRYYQLSNSVSTHRVIGSIYVGNVPTSDPADVFEFHRRLIEKLLEYEDVLNAFSDEGSELGIYITEPDVRLRLIIDGRNSELIKVDPDDEKVDDPRITMSWSVAYKFWFGSIDIMSALLTGSIKVEGQNMDPLFKLKSIVSRAREACEVVSSELGWT